MVSYITIELVNLWAEFCRAYYLSTAMHAKRLVGGPVTHAQASIQLKDDAIRFACTTADPRLAGKPGPFTRWDEPAWHDVPVFRRLMTALSPSSLNNIYAALSQPVRVLPDIITFRNFFAHRSENTATKVRRLARRYRLQTDQHPVDTLASYPPGRPQPLLVDFVDEMRLLIDAL
jgi:hypothetical protein